MEVIIGLQPGVPRIVSTSAYAYKANVPISSARSRSSIYCHRLSSSNCVFILRPFAPSTNCGGAAEYAAEIAQRSQSQRKNPYA